MFCERVSASVGREYCRYLVPALGATLSTSFYLFADTVMVGHRLGGEALAALNVMVPLEFACFAVGAWLGNGGAIGVTRSQGNGALAVARGVWRTLELAVAFAVLSWPVGVGAMLVLVYGVLGADAPPSLTAAALDYGRWIALGSPCFVLGAVLPHYCAIQGLRGGRWGRWCVAGWRISHWIGSFSILWGGELAGRRWRRCLGARFRWG
ncbi:MAG: MATE family efflux transporter [Candidatus Spyradenecus sp.]